MELGDLRERLKGLPLLKVILPKAKTPRGEISTEAVTRESQARITQDPVVKEDSGQTSYDGKRISNP